MVSDQEDIACDRFGNACVQCFQMGSVNTSEISGSARATIFQFGQDNKVELMNENKQVIFESKPVDVECAVYLVKYRPSTEDKAVQTDEEITITLSQPVNDTCQLTVSERVLNLLSSALGSVFRTLSMAVRNIREGSIIVTLQPQNKKALHKLFSALKEGRVLDDMVCEVLKTQRESLVVEEEEFNRMVVKIYIPETLFPSGFTPRAFPSYAEILRELEEAMKTDDEPEQSFLVTKETGDSSLLDTEQHERQMHLTKEQVRVLPYEDRIILAVKNIDGGKREVAKGMRDSADYLEKQQRDMDIAKIGFAAGGITGSIFAVIGLALAPVTFGASIGLTVAGMAMGISSGAGGLATEIADKIINSKALKKAQEKIDSHNRKSEELLKLMDTMREQGGEDRFQRFIDEKLRKTSPRFYNWLLRKASPKSSDPEPAKAGIRAAAAAGKIAAEVLEAGGKAIKFGSLICSVFTIPLDLHTIVSNSIKVHKRTPSETAEYIRGLADELESRGKLDAVEELKRHAKRLEREAKRHEQQWAMSVKQIGQDVTLKLEYIAMLYDTLRKQGLRIQVVSLFTHIVTRPLVLFILPYLFTSDPVTWISRGAVVSLIYDGFYLVLNIAMEVYTHWIVIESRRETERGMYAARNVFKTAPPSVLSFAEQRSRSSNTLHKLELKDSSKYHNIFELGLVVLKSLLNVGILYCLSAGTDLTERYELQKEQQWSVISYLVSWLWISPLSETPYRPDLVIFWLAVCIYLLTSIAREHRDKSMCLLAKDLIDLGEKFNKKLNELVGECYGGPVQTEGANQEWYFTS